MRVRTYRDTGVIMFGFWVEVVEIYVACYFTFWHWGLKVWFGGE